MQEILFYHSPIGLVLSTLTLIMAILYPITIGQKVRLKQLPVPLRQLILIMIFWSGTSIIGNLFFSGPGYSIVKHILFGFQSICWVQIGNASYHLCTLNLKSVRSNFWKLSNIFGALTAIITTVMFCVSPAKMYSLCHTGISILDERPTFVAYSVIFFIYAVPELLITIYSLLKKSLHAGDSILSRTNFQLFGSFTFFGSIAILFDFILPFAYSFNLPGTIPQFLMWSQYAIILLTLLSGQYYSSISYRNKSSQWLLNNLVNALGDCVIYFDNEGQIHQMNPAARSLFQIQEDMKPGFKVQDILPGLQIFKDVAYNNVNITVNDEQHTFNVNIFNMKLTLTTSVNVLLLRDQTNTIFYQQQIKELNSHFVEYKQDLIRYQDRLNISEKKSQESKTLNDTLINALPFQFWSKNENGVYLTQNIKDIQMRGNLNKTTDEANAISYYEEEARDNGNSTIHTSYENGEHEEITEDQANLEMKNERPVHIYQNHFIPIIVDRPPYKIIGLKIDMTEEKRLERERNLLREQRNIHSRLEELGTICGAFAHDYNNILGSQIGFCELAQEMLNMVGQSIEDEKLKKQLGNAGNFVNEATKAAKRGKESLNVLLDTVRGRTNSQIEDSLFPPTEIVRDVINKLLITIPPTIKINSEKMDDTVLIKAQAPSLDRILSNLANNALYAMKEIGGGTLSFAVVKESLREQLVTPFAPPIPAGDYVKISVSDTGTGMDSGTLERIFAPFFTTKAPGEGLGLGLSSAMRLLKEGNAYFTVQTTLGEGTTFNLYWTLYKDPNKDSKE